MPAGLDPTQRYKVIGPPEFPYKLGKTPARAGAIRYSLSRYIDLDLPQPPPHFRHDDPPPWEDYRGKEFGNCVWAGAANETRLWEHEGGLGLPSFTTKEVNADYAAVSGFNPKKPETDQGTDLGAAAAYRHETGILDTAGRRHRVEAYARVPLHNFDHLKAAMWVLGGIGIGFKFPKYAMDQFKKRKPWSVRWSIRGMLGMDDIAGGHYVPGVGIAENGNIICISWGQEVEMTKGFYLRFADEVIAFFDRERLNKSTRLSPEGFNEDIVNQDLSAAAGGSKVFA